MYVQRMVLALLLGMTLAAGQNGRPVPDDTGPEPKLPDGRSQKEEILKADHEKSLKDADDLVRLTEELKTELEKNDRHVLSVATLRKLDDIEKLTRRIRGRMRRY